MLSSNLLETRVNKIASRDVAYNSPNLDSEQPDRTNSRKVTDMSNTNETPSSLTLYRVEEAAEQLRVSRWKVYHLIQTNQLKTLKIGRRRLIALDDILVFVTKQKEESYD